MSDSTRAEERDQRGATPRKERRTSPGPRAAVPAFVVPLLVGAVATLGFASLWHGLESEARHGRDMRAVQELRLAATRASEAALELDRAIDRIHRNEAAEKLEGALLELVVPAGQAESLAFARRELAGLEIASEHVLAQVRAGTGEELTAAVDRIAAGGRALAAEVARYGETLAVRRAGELPRMRAWAAVSLALVLGLLAFQLTVLLRPSERSTHRHAAALRRTTDLMRASEEQFRSVWESSQHGLALLAATRDERGDVDDFRLVELNDRGAQIFARDAEEALGSRMAELLPPELARIARDKLAEVIEQGEPGEMEAWIELPGIPRRCLAFQVVPVGGGVALSAQDLTARVEAEEQRIAALYELDHRLKNSLAMVIAVLDQTKRYAQDDDDFTEIFRRRIEELSRLHEALSQNGWTGASMNELVELATEPFHGRRLNVSGPLVSLPRYKVFPVGTALYELTTNAAKYGSLSLPDGEVDLSWDVEHDGDDSSLHLRWIERNGPRVAQPERRGYGTTMIECGIPYQTGGSADMDWAPDGLRCELVVPLGETA